MRQLACSGTMRGRTWPGLGQDSDVNVIYLSEIQQGLLLLVPKRYFGPAVVLTPLTQMVHWPPVAPWGAAG